MNQTTLTVGNTDELLNIYKETESNEGIFYQALHRPFNLPLASKLRGISLLAVSFDGNYAATKADSQPNCVFVWDLGDLTLNSVVLQQNEITDIKWCPRIGNLNICTKDANRLFLWSPKGASVCQVPVSTGQSGNGEFVITSVKWNPNGQSFAAFDRASLVFVFPQESFFIDTGRKSDSVMISSQNDQDSPDKQHADLNHYNE